jgi:hypothetical protein
MQNDCFDLFIPGGYVQLRPWEDSVELGHRYGMPVYPALEESRFIDLDGGFERNTLQTYRARAAGVWNAGADGVYLFNAFYLFEPSHDAYRELGDSRVLERKDKTYFASYMSTALLDGFLKGSDRRHMMLPALHSKDPSVLHRHPTRHLNTKRGQATTAYLRIEDDFTSYAPGDGGVNVVLRIWVDSVTRAGDLLVTVNGHALTDGQLDGYVLEYRVEPRMLRQGVNEIGFTSAGDGSDGPVVCDLQMRVLYDKPGT